MNVILNVVKHLLKILRYAQDDSELFRMTINSSMKNMFKEK